MVNFTCIVYSSQSEQSFLSAQPVRYKSKTIFPALSTDYVTVAFVTGGKFSRVFHRLQVSLVPLTAKTFTTFCINCVFSRAFHRLRFCYDLWKDFFAMIVMSVDFMCFWFYRDVLRQCYKLSSGNYYRFALVHALAWTIELWCKREVWRVRKTSKIL